MPATKPPPTHSLTTGIGFGGVLAHELALQLSASSAEPPLALALLEPPQSLRFPAMLLSWLPEQQRAEVCQVASALYPAVAAAGSNAPSFEAFVARLASIPDHNQQLDYVATFKPPEVCVVNQMRREVAEECSCLVPTMPPRLPASPQPDRPPPLPPAASHRFSCRRARPPGSCASPPCWPA